MMFRKWLVVAAMASGLALSACGGGDGDDTPPPPPPADGGSDSGTDSGPPPVTQPVAQRCTSGTNCPDPDDETGIGIDAARAENANYACHGTRTAPAGGDSIEFPIRVEEFRDGNVVEGLCVKFFPDNVVTAEACDESSDYVTDAEGLINVTAPAGGWYAYRIFPKAGPTPSLEIVGSLQVNEPAPATGGGSPLEGNSVNRATLNLIPTVLGFPQSPGTAIVAGTVQDCDEKAVYGAVVRMYSSSGTLIAEGEAASDPHFRYFDGDDFPKDGQPWSHTDGLFAAANIPIATPGDLLFVEIWGRRDGDAEPVLLGCEQVPLHPDTVSIINVGPLRADGPSCPGLGG